jgi:hypothetical protein
MAGNLRADNNGDILVEFDYNNIIVVDPNKTIDSQGKIQERLIDHESLVMYANLEAEVLPRTKLAVGASPEDRIRTISVAKMNFLKPTKDNFLGVGYYDELTGENSTKFKGANQMMEKTIIPTDGTKPYNTSSPADLTNVFDNGLLGITSINITTNSSFVPSVSMKLEDVQGKALFSLGNNSPYAAFFNLPYPPFYLTLKGYYGQAIRYQLNLEKFNATFNTFSGNYQVDLQFKGYKFNVLNEISMSHLLAVPHMYGQTFNISTTPGGTQESNKAAESQSKTQGVVSKNNSQSGDAFTTQIVSERGYQKIAEVYSEYKSKGLVAPDLPEITLFQLMTKLSTFENNIMNSFPKAKVEPLTNIRNYKEVLKQYFSAVRGANVSWFNTYLDPKPIVLNNTSERVYIFKKLEQTEKDTAIELLKSYITKFNKALSENNTLGKNGTAPIPNPIKFDNIIINPLADGAINWEETFKLQTGKGLPTEEDIIAIKERIYQIKTPNTLVLNDVNGKKTPEVVNTSFFIFEGNNRFDSQISLLETGANKKLAEYESLISAELLRKIEDTDNGLGFKPTVRNMIAVVMASAEAFIRLLDDVHTNAWNVKYDPVRKRAIMDNPSSAQSSETRQQVPISVSSQESNQGLSNSQEPVYPWPLFFVETPEDKKGRFQLKYIADPTVVDRTQGYLYDKWPEVEFVEEYMKGLTQKFSVPIAPPPLDNERDTNRININAIEFPSAGLPYVNKEEVKFFYEIWERQFLTSHYSGLIRANSNQIDELIKLNVEAEVNNIVKGLGVSSPYLTLKLKNYNLKANSYPQFLSTISNNGTGRAYQDYIRDFFVTPYIKNLVDNSYSILSTSDIGKIPQVSTKSLALESLIKNASNNPLIVDTLPYTDSTWCLSNLSSSNKSIGNEVYDTKKTLKIFEPRKIISNFNDIYNFTTNRPVTNFSFYQNQNPSLIASQDTSLNPYGFEDFYINRVPNDFVATEGYCNSTTPTNALPFKTTTSMLNTPYFVNSIMNGVQNNRTSDPYPYVQSAYLFLNSLPLATLRERYKTNTGTFVDELDYISSCFKKFGAIHKLPYAWILKYGSIWHRYKKYKESNVDILSSAWTNFDYKTNYSPILSSITQTYEFNYNETPISITLQQETPTTVNMNVGFYPKVINDFNVFYNGFELYENYTNIEIENSVKGGMKLYNFNDSNIYAKQNDKTLNLTTYSVLLSSSNYYPDVTCNPVSNTKGIDYYVVPSFGNPLNQTQISCVDNLTTDPITKVDLTSNPNVYNGSVRTLWSAPNYGYFDSNQIAYPQPDSYINLINNGETQTPLYFLNGDNYTKIEEIFSVFEKKILDSFEQEFLNFSKPITNSSTADEVAQFQTSVVQVNATFRNFQSLFRNLMVVPIQGKGVSDLTYFSNTIGNQYNVFQEGIKDFMNYDVLFKYGNPSNYNRRIFDSYLSHNDTQKVVDPIEFLPYVQNTLPSKNSSLSLSQSQLLNQRAWNALETEVGFSTINNVKYSSTGSYITDFFIDNNILFSVENVVLLAPIIKMYATQKLKNPTTTVAQFKSQINQYLTNEDVLQNNFLNLVLDGVRRDLPNQEQLPEKTIQSVIDGQQSKVENYEVFKSLNDKWVSGGDYKTKTLFEDILFLDRASRNIGDTILLDIFEMRNMFNQKSLNETMSVYTFISGLLIKNNFTVMNLPAYINFYNVQDVDGTTIPNRAEGSLEFANNLWGTFLDVDYRKSSSKMVCFYVGKPSQYLNLPKGNFRFRDDAFDMSRASENPLIENQVGKKDWGVSNKCVGFTVDIGTRNQNVFYSFNVSQDNGTATSESITTQLNLVDQSSGKNVATQNASLYNLYKQRSYKCSVVCLGNALLQPTMYFNLRHVPMFNGPYMIQQVEHSIQPGQFQTTFQGIRQGVYDLPAIDSFIQSINENLLTKVEELLKIKKDTINVLSATTENNKTSNTVQSANNTKGTTNECESQVLPIYLAKKYQATNAVLTKITEKEFADVLKRIMPNNPNLATIIYCISYLRTFQKDSNSKLGKFNGWNNNFATIPLNVDYGQIDGTFLSTYSCVNLNPNPSTKGTTPVANFASVDNFVSFMTARLQERVPQVLDLGLVKYYACFWPVESMGVSVSTYDTNINNYKTTKESFDKALTSALSVGVATKAIVEDLKNQINKVEGQGTTNGVPNTTAVTSQLSCPPPIITSFSPLSGNTGTIVQVNGTDFNGTSLITVNGVNVTSTEFTVFNNTTLRFNTPKIGTGTVINKGKIVITTPNGVFTSVGEYTFDPSIIASSASSPGGYQNPQNQTTNLPQSQTVNLNPQETGPDPLVTVVDDTIKGELTNQIIISVNSTVGVWIIQNSVEMTVSIFDEIKENNQVKKILSRVVKKTITNYVNNNVFSITHNQIANMIINQPVGEFLLNPIKDGQVVTIQFTVTSNAVDKIKYPNPITRSATFYFTQSRYVTTSVVNEARPGSLIKVSETQSGGLPNFNGPDYYNIKKPAGGYITLQFTCTNLINKGDFSIYSIPAFDKQTITIVNNSDTKYANVVTINNLGTFQAEVGYTSEDYVVTDTTSSNFGKPISASAVSPPFTL